MNKHQQFPQVHNWNGKSLGSDNIIYCDDCQSSEKICQICGNCSCDDYPCEHQRKENDKKPTRSQAQTS